MTVKELADIFINWPDQDEEVMIAFDSGVRMGVDVVTNWHDKEAGKHILVLTSRDEYISKDNWDA